MIAPAFAAAGQYIRTAAARWDAEVPVMGAIVNQLRGLQFQGYDAGLFSETMTAHVGLAQKIVDRLTEGQAVAKRFADDLNHTAAEFERMDHNAAGQVDKMAVPPPKTKIIR